MAPAAHGRVGHDGPQLVAHQGCGGDPAAMRVWAHRTCTPSNAQPSHSPHCAAHDSPNHGGRARTTCPSITSTCSQRHNHYTGLHSAKPRFSAPGEVRPSRTGFRTLRGFRRTTENKEDTTLTSVTLRNNSSNHRPGRAQNPPDGPFTSTNYRSDRWEPHMQ